jgi:hypothetical protein
MALPLGAAAPAGAVVLDPFDNSLGQFVSFEFDQYLV